MWSCTFGILNAVSKVINVQLDREKPNLPPTPVSLRSYRQNIVWHCLCTNAALISLKAVYPNGR